MLELLLSGSGDKEKCLCVAVSGLSLIVLAVGGGILERGTV